MIQKLSNGETIISKEPGNSMLPLLKSKQPVRLVPISWEDCEVGDIVYCKVRGNCFTHLVKGKNDKRVHTRFAPEPNGYLHIGHAKSICLNFGLADTYGGKCNLRFDDTNPKAEKQEYVDAMLEDIKWMGYHPDKITYTSDYFAEIYALTLGLIDKGLAYVDDSTPEDPLE